MDRSILGRAPRCDDEDGQSTAMAPRAARGARSLKDAARSARGQASRFESAPVEPKRHSVLGQRKLRRPKSTVEHRRAADAERRETLLVEYRNQHRSNKVVDARFGEDDEALPADERYYARLQRERLRETRSSRFALEEPSAAVDLTHGGRSLGEIEDDELAGGYGGALGDDGLADTHPDGFGGSDFIKAVHFGGGSEGAALSQKEALDAAIAKHKLARLDRKEAKEKERGLVDRLDADFAALKQLIFSSAAEGGCKAASGGGGGGGDGDGEDAYGDYHSLVAAMQSEIRAQPSDRLHSQAELAAAEQQRLRALEVDRVRRAGGGEGGEGSAGGGRRATGDELTDDFAAGGGEEGSEEEEVMVPLRRARGGAWRGAEGRGEEGGEEGESESGDGEEEGPSESEGEEHGAGRVEEEQGEEDQEEELEAIFGGSGSDMPQRPGAGKRVDRRTPAGATPPAAPDLPFVIACPSTPAELEAIFSMAGPCLSRQSEAMHRLLAGSHVHLSEPNRAKLATLASLLLRRLMLLAADGQLPSTRPVTGAVHALAGQVPLEVAAAILTRLAAARAAWRKAKKGVSGVLVPLPPGALALVALCCQLYPPSDYRHSVLTPCALLVGEVLGQQPLPASRMALRRTLFLMGQAVRIIGAERRFMPELHSTAVRLARAMLLQSQHSAAPQPWTAAGALPSGGWPGAAAAPGPLSFGTLRPSAAALGAEAIEQCVVDEGGLLLSLVQTLATLHEPDLPSFPELFTPLLHACSASPAAAPLPPALVSARDATGILLSSLVSRASGRRVALRLQRAAPVPIKALNPVYDDDFQPERDVDPDRDRAALRHLKRQTKKEHKGAVRELRKDGAFLAAERAREKGERDEYLEGRGKRAVAIMQEQEHLWKEQKKVKRDSAKLL